MQCKVSRKDEPVGQRTHLGNGGADGREERGGDTESHNAEAEKCKVQLAGHERAGRDTEERQ
eukprot:11885807-Heterocapsa_arctica.AAC.1